MLQLIKNPDGLRIGNLIFVDSIVFPPNFITARPTLIGEGFENAFNEEPSNCAYLNAEDKWMKQLLTEEKDGKLCNGEFTAEKIYEPKGMFDEKFTTWKIKFGENEAEISFIHELQNYYFDWTHSHLLEGGKKNEKENAT